MRKEVEACCYRSVLVLLFQRMSSNVEFVFEEDAFPMVCDKGVPIGRTEFGRRVQKTKEKQDAWAQQECWHSRILLHKCLERAGRTNTCNDEAKAFEECTKHFKAYKKKKRAEWKLMLRNDCLVVDDKT